jgi:type I restriction enzyme R subunit
VSEVNEGLVEQLAISELESAGFVHRTGAGLAESGLSPQHGIISALLRQAITELNPMLSLNEIGDVARVLSRPPYPSLIENNRWFHDLLANGLPVEYKDAKTGETRGGQARLIDFDTPEKNDFLVVRQLTVGETSVKTIRPDLVLFVNGLPLVVIELKDPGNTAADLNLAIDQLARYKTGAPDLFVPNLAMVASDGLLTRVGSITSGRQRFMPWRPAGGGEPTLQALIRELLNPSALLDYLRSCVAFEEDERGNIVKKVAGYHQFRAVRKARAKVIAAQALTAADLAQKTRSGVEYHGKPGGVVWHTQGSGKSLTMLMLAGTLVRAAVWCSRRSTSSPRRTMPSANGRISSLWRTRHTGASTGSSRAERAGCAMRCLTRRSSGSPARR